jgi:peptidoglycan/LPS O-acetylase OafA/YrhL
LLAALAMVLPAAVRAMGAPDSCKPVLFFGDFLMGMALAGISGPFRGHGGRLYLSGAALGLATILAGRAIPSWAVFDGALRLSNAAAVLGLAAGGGAAAAILSRSWMVLAGRASYAIYILHIPLLWWYKRTFLYYLLPGPAAAVVYIALVVAVSVAVTLWIEEPANRLIRDKARAWLRQDRETAAGAPERAGGLAIETAQ